MSNLNNYINYCSHHIKSGAIIEQIPIESVKERLGFGYINSTLAESWRSVLDVFLPEKPNFAVCEEGFKVLLDPEAVLVVHESSPYIGKSLTTSVPIKKCTIVIEYSGDIIDRKGHDLDYALNNGYSKETLSSLFDTLNTYKYKDQHRLELANSYVKKAIKGLFSPSHFIEMMFDETVSFTMIDAKENGNLARFAAHMPSGEDIFKGYKVATASLSSMCLPSMVGYVKCFLFSLRDIQVNEELGFDYGKNYRFSDKAGPLYFDSETNLLINRNGTLHNPNFDYVAGHNRIDNDEL